MQGRQKANSKYSTNNPLFRSWIEIPGFNSTSIVITICIHPVFQQTLINTTYDMHCTRHLGTNWNRKIN